MDELPQGAWFYSKEGRRSGPVSLEELKALAQGGGLNPRLDLVWVQGMADWTVAGEVEGLFVRKAAPPPAQETLSQDAGPYTTPRQDSAAELMGREVNWPGTGRLGYFVAIWVFPMLFGFVVGLFTPLIQGQFGGPVGEWAFLAASLLPLPVAIWFSLSRLVNLGMSRWWFLGNFVPILNLWVGYRCFACPTGYAFHKKMDGVGIFLAILYWLVLLAFLAILVIFIVMVFMEGGGSDFQEMLRGFAEQVEGAGS